MCIKVVIDSVTLNFNYFGTCFMTMFTNTSKVVTQWKWHWSIGIDPSSNSNAKIQCIREIDIYMEMSSNTYFELFKEFLK